MKFFRNNWYWVLGIIICLIIICLVVGSIIVIQRGQQQIAQLGPTALDVADHTPGPTNPPPPGETQPPQAKSDNTAQSSDVYSNEINRIYSEGHTKETIALSRSIIRDRPDSVDALMARRFLAVEDENGVPDESQVRAKYYEALKYHPESSLLLGELASLIWYDSPKEAISYALKGLRNNNSHLDGARLHGILGFAYQRLGDYKTAWVHLKKGQAFTEQCFSCCPSPGKGTLHFEVAKSDDYSVHIAAIESGRPLVQRQQELRSSVDDAAVFEELGAFLEWAGAIMRDTPITTNNFLAKELESHLLGQKTTFHPERITRAFELMERHKQSKGMRLLQQSDPPLAREVLRLLNKK